MSTVGVAEVELRARTAQFTREMRGALRTFQEVGQEMQQVGKNLSLKVTAPLLAMAGAGAKMSVDFETSMAKITGLVGVAKSDLEGMIPPLKNMAGEYGISANKAAEALFFITSAGLRGADAMTVLDASLRGSAVGLGEVSTIADLATSAVNAYGAANLNGTQAVDVLTAAVREGKLEADQLAGSMGRVLPIASAMGISLNEVGATMAAMSRTGTGASEAATQLRNIMTSLLKPTGDAQKALAGLGTSAGELRQQIQEQGLLSVLEMLASEFEKNDDLAVQVFGNVRALSGIMDLMGTNVEGTRAIFESMNVATGSLDSAFSDLEQTTGYAMSGALTEMKLALMEIGDLLLPILSDVAEAMATVARAARDMPRSAKLAALGVGALFAAVGPVLASLGFLGILLSGNAKSLLLFKKMAVAAGKAVLYLAGTFRALWVAIGPKGWIVLGIGLAAAATVKWIQRNREARNSIRDMDSALAQARAGIDGLKDSWEALTDAQLQNQIAQRTTRMAEIQSNLDVLEPQWDQGTSSAVVDQIMGHRAALQAEKEAVAELNRMLLERNQIEGITVEAIQDRTAATRAASEAELEALARSREFIEDFSQRLEDTKRLIAAYAESSAAGEAMQAQLSREADLRDAQAEAVAGQVEAAVALVDAYHDQVALLEESRQATAESERQQAEYTRELERQAEVLREAQRQADERKRSRDEEISRMRGLLRIYREHTGSQKELEAAVAAYNREAAITAAVLEELARDGTQNARVLRAQTEEAYDLAAALAAVEGQAQKTGDGLRSIAASTLGMITTQVDGVIGQLANVAQAALAGGLVGAVGAVGGIIAGNLTRQDPQEAAMAEAVSSATEALGQFAERLREVSQMQELQMEAQNLFGDALRNIGLGPMENQIQSTGPYIQQLIREGHSLEEVYRRLAQGGLFHRNVLEKIEEPLRAYIEALAALEAFRLREVAAMEQEFAVRALVAQGRDQEAEELRQQYQNLQELTAARELEDAALVALIESVHELEQAARDAAEASRQADLLDGFMQDLEDLRLALDGTPLEQFTARLERGVQQQIEAYQDLLDQGIITAEQFAEIEQLLGREVAQAIEAYTQSLRDSAQAAREAAAAERFRAAQEIQNLQVRLLRARGLEEEAARLQAVLEIQQAVNDGKSREYILLLQQIHAQEALARANRNATGAVQATAKTLQDTSKILNAPSGFRESLIRWRAQSTEALTAASRTLGVTSRTSSPARTLASSGDTTGATGGVGSQPPGTPGAVSMEGTSEMVTALGEVTRALREFGPFPTEDATVLSMLSQSLSTLDAFTRSGTAGTGPAVEAMLRNLQSSPGPFTGSGQTAVTQEINLTISGEFVLPNVKSGEDLMQELLVISNRKVRAGQPNPWTNLVETN